jgi:hypothetical protein
MGEDRAPKRTDTGHMAAREYEIVVKGRLSEKFGSAFEGLRVEPRPGETVLRGSFADQAQLHGTLDRIRNLGIELVSVNAGS